MNEKEMFLSSYEREYGITLKFLEAFPAENSDFRPNAHLQSAQEIAWMFPEEERILISGALDGDVVFKKNTPPETFDEIKKAYEDTHRMLAERIKELSDTGFNEMITFGSGSDNAQEMRRGDVLWLAVMDAAHHRGQFSVYIRMAGGNVPPLSDLYEAATS